MFWRDVPGFAMHFLIYEKIKTLNPFPQGQENYSEMYNLLWTMNAGGIAGMIRWTFGIPQDIIKTKQMMHRGKDPLPAIQVLKSLLKEGGVKRIFNGTRPTLVRGYL